MSVFSLYQFLVLTPAELYYPCQDPSRFPRPSLTIGARAVNPAGTARTLAIAHRVPPQHRGRPPRRESRARTVPPVDPPRHHRRPENHVDARKTGKPREILSPNFPRNSPNFSKLFPISLLFLFPFFFSLFYFSFFLLPFFFLFLFPFPFFFSSPFLLLPG
jgi:hypothetical protein